MSLVATDVNPCYLAYHHADKLFGLAIRKKKFVYLTCLHPLSYLWSNLQGDIPKVEDGYVYFVAFAKLLQRDAASQAIEILQQTEVEPLQAVSNTAVREVTVFEDGDIVGVEEDYGIAFHHPRKAFDYINKSNYIKTVHEDFGIPHNSEDLVLFFPFKNMCEDNLESPFRVVPKNQITTYRRAHELQRRDEERPRPTNLLPPILSSVSPSISGEAVNTVSAVNSTSTVSSSARQPTVAPVPAIRNSPSSSSTLSNSKSHTSTSSVNREQRVNFTKETNKHEVLQQHETQPEQQQGEVVVSFSAVANTPSLEDSVLPDDQVIIFNKRDIGMIGSEEDQAPKSNSANKKAKIEINLLSPTEYLLAINEARTRYNEQEQHDQVLKELARDPKTPFAILYNQLRQVHRWRYTYPEIRFLKQHDLSKLTPEIYFRPGVDEKNPLIEHGKDFYISHEEVFESVRRIFGLRKVVHHVKA